MNEFAICDCCLRVSDRLWIYHHRGFCIYRSVQLAFLAGGWSFCVFCHGLRNDMDTLIARVLVLNPELCPAYVRDAYEAMMAASYGDPIEWHSGTPLPTCEEAA
jgi:hypothetical protein